MANYRDAQQTMQIKQQVLSAAAHLFLTKGYSATTVKEIAKMAEISTSTLMYVCKSKEDILALLVQYVLEGQFARTNRLLEGVTEDKILFYAAETTLQLHIVESSETLRELYNMAYSLPKTTEMIQHILTHKLEGVFGDHLPDLETKDFFELEVASGGIMRGFMTIPCDMYFTMQRKVERFLETTFLVYRVPDEKIQEAIDFVGQFDFESIAKSVVEELINKLKILS